MIERACKDYALRVDGALWPDAYDEHEVLALRAQMREILLNAIGAAPAASGGEEKCLATSSAKFVFSVCLDGSS